LLKTHRKKGSTPARVHKHTTAARDFRAELEKLAAEEPDVLDDAIPEEVADNVEESDDAEVDQWLNEHGARDEQDEA
jgi:hypothetical protein